jgi:hypothetical protein
MWSFACYQLAMLGVVEATVPTDEEKNKLCPPIPYWEKQKDYASAFLAGMANDRARAAYPALANWARDTRLNPFSALGAHRDNPAVGEARERMKRYGAAAAGNLMRLVRS